MTRYFGQRKSGRLNQGVKNDKFFIKHRKKVDLPQYDKSHRGPARIPNTKGLQKYQRGKSLDSTSRHFSPRKSDEFNQGEKTNKFVKPRENVGFSQDDKPFHGPACKPTENVGFSQDDKPFHGPARIPTTEASYKYETGKSLDSTSRHFVRRKSDEFNQGEKSNKFIKPRENVGFSQDDKPFHGPARIPTTQSLHKYETGKSLDPTSRHFVPRKSDEFNQGEKSNKFIKPRQNVGFSQDDKPFHGPARIPTTQASHKYETGKSRNSMSRYFVRRKSEEFNQGEKSNKFIKPRENVVFSQDDKPFHGPARIPTTQASHKYEIGKSPDSMSRYFVRRNDKLNQGVKSNKFIKPRDNFDLLEDDLFEDRDEPAPIPTEVLKKYQRGESLDSRGIKIVDRKIDLINADKKIKQSVRQAARNELLLPEQAGYLEPDDNEDTFRIQQTDLSNVVDITSASKIFSLSLTEFGPYKINYSRDGRHLLLGGYRGHVAALDWVTKRLLCEVNVMQSVHDLCWLHLPTMFATAQKDWVYIYDNKGVELHCVKQLNRVLQLEFLPYHFLLATSSEKGFISWLDITIGKMVKETYTNAGRLNIMCQNPYNAMVATGHPNGSVSMWSPNVEKPVVKIFCHPHPIRSMAIDSKGLYLATASMDRSLKIYDVRTYKCLQSYKLGAAAGFLDFSQMGLLAVGMGNLVEVYKDCCTQTTTSPYMRHRNTTTVSDVQFCPYEDVLGVGYSSGFSSLVIPGAGQPNFDSYESNPFMTKSQRREMEVKSLLDKIQPELITLDPGHLGTINVTSMEEKLEQRNSLNSVKPKTVEHPKFKRRGKTVEAFKSKTIVKETAKREYIKEAIKEKALVQKKNTEHFGVLDRFKPKSN